MTLELDKEVIINLRDSIRPRVVDDRGRTWDFRAQGTGPEAFNSSLGSENRNVPSHCQKSFIKRYKIET